MWPARCPWPEAPWPLKPKASPPLHSKLWRPLPAPGRLGLPPPPDEAPGTPRPRPPQRPSAPEGNLRPAREAHRPRRGAAAAALTPRDSGGLPGPPLPPRHPALPSPSSLHTTESTACPPVSPDPGRPRRQGARRPPPRRPLPLTRQSDRRPGAGTRGGHRSGVGRGPSPGLPPGPRGRGLAAHTWSTSPVRGRRRLAAPARLVVRGKRRPAPGVQ